MNGAFPMVAPGEVYRERRARLAARLTRPMVLCAGHAPARNYAANPHEFRAGSSYLYFGGPPIEHAALLIEPSGDGCVGCKLLRPPAGPDDALWVGALPPDEVIAAAAGLDTSALAAPRDLPTLLAGYAAGCVTPPCPETFKWIDLHDLRPATPEELSTIIELRLCKDAHELNAMREAARVTCAAHRAAMSAARAGRREADAAAALMQVLVAHGCRPAFTPIVTVRGEVLHGQGYGNTLEAGALLLIDAGAEEPGGYASDVTRTVPVGGRWSDVQRVLYDVVHRALNAAVDACVAGRRYRDVHEVAAGVICEGLVDAGLLKGTPRSLLERRAHTLFFPHGVGHLIGLDAHDMEDFGDLAGYAPGRTRRPGFGDKFLRLDRDLAPGMTVTIEPGIYLVPAIWATAALVDPFADVVRQNKIEALLAARFGGIRIEHTVCVRAQGGPDVLTADVPTDADEVAACVAADYPPGT